MRPIPEDDLEPLAIGAWILGAGGGGSPYHGYLNVRQLYRAGHRVQLMDPASLDDDDLVAVVSNMGAPLVGQERLSDPAVAARPVRMMQEYLGRPFRAVMSLEIGGGNAIQPLLVAAVVDLPVVDADCMGRAFPEAQMTSFAIGELPMFPLTLADVRDNEVIVARAASWPWMERISRRVCVAVGSIAATCKAPRTGREVKAWGILHSVTRAVGIGRAVLTARVRREDPIGAVVAHTGGKRLFAGKIVDVDRRTTEGFLRGRARIAGIDEDRGRDLVLEFQNEFAVGWLDGRAAVMTPEIICVMDTVAGEAIGTETLRYGQRVTVVALPCAPILTTPKGLSLVGPRAFGYDLDFSSVFARTAA
ncbi:MAG TPA: DUF917 domain-containing protein [Vicinamibacterales bacterium]|nr:DUF917 domain-containing protein [Vicinamibacterales bacterium]